jgi:hypothetical protein
MFQAMMIVVIGLMTLIGFSVKALSANTAYTGADDGLGYGPVKGTTHVYRNAFVGATAGYLRGLVAGDKFMGIAYEEVDNSSGSDGDLQVQYAQKGEFLLTGAGFAATDVGKQVFASDDCTLTLTATGNSRVGIIQRYVSSTQVWVRIDTTREVPATALTTQLTTITHTAPTTADYALQNLTASGGYGFATADEGNSVLAVVANLQTRVAELEAKLKAKGIVA